MKKLILILSCIILTKICIGQVGKEYDFFIMKADSLYDAKDFKGSAFAYSDGFKVSGGKELPLDRYNAACSWALAGVPDSAFVCLEFIFNKSEFASERTLKEDEDLVSLHADKRWEDLLKRIREKKEKADSKRDKVLVHELESIYDEDQEYRQKIDGVRNKYGSDSQEMKDLWKTINEKDSINLVKVKAILEKYGWLGPDEVGKLGSQALFLVIQHADLETQEKYLPMMKEAVKNGKAMPSSLALLIDRVEMRNGRPQVYGSQITFKDGKNIIYPITDEVNVNKRRAEMGLEPLEKYVKNWNIDYKLPSK